jgi:hypothetical protein
MKTTPFVQSVSQNVFRQAGQGYGRGRTVQRWKKQNNGLSDDVMMDVMMDVRDGTSVSACPTIVKILRS